MLYGIIVFLGVVADQLTKLWVSGSLVGKGVVEIIPGIIGFRYVENTGAAFSIFASNTLMLTIISAVLIIFLTYLIWRYRKGHKMLNISLALIIAGAIGNLIDRVFAGYVVDFIEFRFVNFAVFNVADICVTIGTILLAVYILFLSPERKKKKTEEVTDERGEHGDNAGD